MLIDNMDDRDILIKYLDLVDRGSQFCSQEAHKTVNLFVGVTFFLYLVYAFNIQDLNVFGIKANVPKSIILGVAPLVLTYLYHNMVCFFKLESAYHEEIKQAMKELGVKSKAGFSNWQIELLVRPSYYTWSFLRDEVKGSSKLLKVCGLVLYMIIFFIYFITPLLLITFFMFVGQAEINSVWIYLPYLIVTFVTIYSFLQIFEELPRYTFYRLSNQPEEE